MQDDGPRFRLWDPGVIGRILAGKPPGSGFGKGEDEKAGALPHEDGVDVESG